MTRAVGGAIGDRGPFDAPREVRHPGLPVTGTVSATIVATEDRATRTVRLAVTGRDWIRTADGYVAVRPREVVITYSRTARDFWQVESAHIRGPARYEQGDRAPNTTITWDGAALDHPALPRWLAVAFTAHRPTAEQGAF